MLLKLGGLPEARAAGGFLWLLSSMSGGYWILSWCLSHLALAIHEGLLEEFAILFAVAYNVALAVLYASVMALAVAASGAPHEALSWRQAAGFVFVFYSLKSVYADHATEEINEYAVLGFLAGVAAYLCFAVFPDFLVNPFTLGVYQVAAWIGNGWIGRLCSVFLIVRLLYVLARGAWRRLRDALSFQPRIRVRGRG